MPLQRCQADGESGWRWGDAGKCYTGPDAKRRAAIQGYAIGKQMKSFQNTVRILKVDEDQHLVFGWFSEIEKNGKPIEDSQGDVISEADLEKAAYGFVLDARVAGEMHKRIGVGALIESMVFTREKQKAMGIDLGKISWWGGFRISDEDTWAKVKSGKLPAFSICGVAESTPITAEAA